MDVLFRLGEGSVADVRAEMAAPPSYSAVRALLGLLAEKGHVRRRKVGRKYVYTPAVPAAHARRNALRHLVRTFFDGSTEKAFAWFLDSEAKELGDEELDRLAERIEAARRAAGPTRGRSGEQDRERDRRDP